MTGTRYLLALFIRHLMREAQRQYIQPDEVLNIPIDPISTTIEIERFTVRHRCAVDSGMRIKSSNGDYDTFTDDGDSFLHAEFMKYERANQKAIAKEENDRYRY